MADAYVLTIDQTEPGILVLALADTDGEAVAASDIRYGTPGPAGQGQHVDNLLLTAVDNLFKESTIDRSALVSVVVGPGIDKTSSLYRIVTSFASAVAAARGAGR